MAFLVGAILLVVGMMFFTLGAEISMTPMGERIGTRISSSKRLPFIRVVVLYVGFIITVSEPDLQVLPNKFRRYRTYDTDLCGSGRRWDISCGCRLFVCYLELRCTICCCLLSGDIYLTFFVSKDFLAIAFDSGGVTTGPMTVPFIMALGRILRGT